MNKLKLIHDKENFKLEINDTLINFIKSYKIEADVDGGIDLTLKMSIDIEKSSIDINNIDINLK